MSSSQTRQAAKNWGLWPQCLLFVSLDSLTPILYRSPQHPHHYPLGQKMAQWLVFSSPPPLPLTEVTLLQIIHRLCSAAAACEHLPGGKIPRARSWRERATTCMFCCIWLISNKYYNSSYVFGQLSNILQLAVNGYVPHRKREWGWLWSEGVEKQVVKL